jgi:hypothetical protein
MDTNQIVEQAEFGLSLARLARAISDQPAPEIEETEQVLRTVKVPPRRDVI